MNTFEDGAVSMARNTKPAVELVRQGKWTLDQMDRWLDAVINTDAAFAKEAQAMIEAK